MSLVKLQQIRDKQKYPAIVKQKYPALKFSQTVIAKFKQYIQIYAS